MARKRVKKLKIVVTCPKCGKQGIIGVDKIRTRGKLYIYLVVRHYVRGRVQRCFIKRIEG
jgi:transcription elongation factor Elf1